MYCVHCGKEISDGARFCPHCGSPVGQANQPPVISSPKKKGHGLKVVAIVCVVALVLAAAGGAVYALPDSAEEDAALSQTANATVDAGVYHTVGLRPDGTVIAAGNIGEQTHVEGWTDMAPSLPPGKNGMMSAMYPTGRISWRWLPVKVTQLVSVPMALS